MDGLKYKHTHIHTLLLPPPKKELKERKEKKRRRRRERQTTRQTMTKGEGGGREGGKSQDGMSAEDDEIRWNNCKFENIDGPKVLVIGTTKFE